MKVLVSIYNPAEFYPPTLNAVEYLATKYHQIVLVTHAIAGEDRWNFAPNVHVEYLADWPTATQSAGHWQNIRRFLRFTKQFRKTMAREQYDIVLLYEPYAALAYKLSRLFLAHKPKVLWYHSHDIYEKSKQGFFSIGRLAIRAEQSFFTDLNIFSLPSNERKEYFPMQSLKGSYFFIPNYPSRIFYSRFYRPKAPDAELRLIFQGRISAGHGLEEIITLLNRPVQGKTLSLHLKGIVAQEYKTKLLTLAQQYKVEGQVHFHGLTSYKEVPALAASCHVGIAIHSKTDIMNKTLGTSSNKIYEYAAVGLPVLLYDNTHFQSHLGKFSWAVFTDCSSDSLQASLRYIISNYASLSEVAHADFLKGLNFETHASTVTDYIDTQHR